MLLISMHRDIVTTLYISNISRNIVGILLTRQLFSQNVILQSQRFMTSHNAFSTPTMQTLCFVAVFSAKSDPSKFAFLVLRYNGGTYRRCRNGIRRTTKEVCLRP